MLGKGISLQDIRAFVIRGLILAATVIVAASSVHTRSSDARNLLSKTRQSSGGSSFDCGYDPAGASDAWSSHRLNKLRVATGSQVRLLSKNSNVTAGPATKDISGLATIEDDGSLVIPAAKFNLKNQSVLLTPLDDGYQVSRSDIEFDNDFGSAVGLFLGADGQFVGDANNAYRDVFLGGARFPFFGSYYETAYVGTNGYITFTQGDTSARISPAALASEIPRIAPLWADLDVTNSGNIYYKRVADHHLFTWNRAGEPLYDGASTFQAVLYDDGRIAFVYKKVKAHAAMIGISPGGWESDPRPILFSKPPDEKITGPFFETFAKDRRLDLPAVLREFYRTHSDSFDTAYIWTDFPYDNGLGVAHSFNIRNDIGGIGLQIADRGSAYGSPSRLSTIITMGNESDWPANPDSHAVGLNSAITIVCHEQGHRWLSYVRFAARNDVRNDLLGRENAHWSFLVDSRTSTEGGYSSLMEGNSWRGSAGSTFTTIESAVNYFSPLDQYLMGLRSADEVGDISFLETNAPLQELLREKSPVSGFSLTAARKTISLDQIVAYEGPRTPDASTAPKTLRIAFIVLTENGKSPSPSTLEKISRYRDRLVNYFSIATGRRGSLDASLDQ